MYATEERCAVESIGVGELRDNLGRILREVEKGGQLLSWPGWIREQAHGRGRVVSPGDLS